VCHARTLFAQLNFDPASDAGGSSTWSVGNRPTSTRTEPDAPPAGAGERPGTMDSVVW